MQGAIVFVSAGQNVAKQALQEIVILPALRPEVMLIALMNVLLILKKKYYKKNQNRALSNAVLDVIDIFWSGQKTVVIFK